MMMMFSYDISLALFVLSMILMICLAVAYKENRGDD